MLHCLTKATVTIILYSHIFNKKIRYTLLTMFTILFGRKTLIQDFFQRMQVFLTISLQKLCKFFTEIFFQYKLSHTGNLWIL